MELSDLGTDRTLKASAQVGGFPKRGFPWENFLRQWQGQNLSPETDRSPENWWLEDESPSNIWSFCRGDVRFREGNYVTRWWFQAFLVFIPISREMIQFDLRIFFKWVGSTTNQKLTWNLKKESCKSGKGKTSTQNTTIVGFQPLMGKGKSST